MLKRMFLLLALALVFVGTVQAATDPFIGDWKFNPVRSKLSDVMKISSLGATKYAFDLGAGNEVIVTDGTDQPGYSGTTLAVSVEAPDRWNVVRKQNGRTLLSAIWNLSKDGNTLRDHFTAFAPNGSPSTVVDYVYTRKASGAGFVGTWVSTDAAGSSDLTLQVRPYENNGLSFIVPSEGTTINAKLDGKEYPNADGTAESSSRRVNAHALEIIRTSKGKIIQSRQFALSADLKTLTMTVNSAGKDEADIFVFERQ
ncbi:MAG TPA: hypothetical protein VGU63_11730 [Candidatus Acidoferrales bacterium]|nr:hypothetical protein [Candidatus Acidoferrales bacterium]